jgi:hypothetical protein
MLKRPSAPGSCSRRPALRCTATRLLLVGVLGVAAAGGTAGLRAQEMLDGCQLVQGTLQCVPGVSADPQQQIRDLRQEIATDQNLETAVEQQIAGLNQVVLQGEAAEGQLLQATLTADAMAGLPPSAFHWYRLQPGASRWLLISEASGPSYQLGPNDVGSQVMLVVAVPQGQGSQRQATAPVGPVQGR